MRRFAATCSALASLVLLLGGVQGTQATLSDQTSMTQVTVAGGSVLPPTGLSVSEQPAAARVSWIPPVGGITPDGYEVFRRAVPGAYGPVPIGSAAGSPWDDTSAAECTTWGYKARSTHLSMRSSFGAEQQIEIDRTGPVTADASAVFVSGPAPVADFVRASGGNVEVYAQVTDACAAASSLTVSFTFTGLGTVATTFGSWTPIIGGPTYNRRFDFALPNGYLPDGTVVTWTINAADPLGNSSATPGTPITSDGQAPIYTRAETISARTNYYDPLLARGEITSDGIARGDGYLVYADFSDVSGIASIEANTSSFTAGGTAIPLSEGSYSTATGEPWPWRSAATIANTGLPNGTRTFTVTAVDRVGNVATTSPAQVVEIDDGNVGGLACRNYNGGSTNRLDAGDYTRLRFNDTIDPGSLAPGWDASPLTFSPMLRTPAGGGAGANQFFDLNGAGLSVVRGSTGSATAYDLGTASGFSAPTTFTGSTFIRGAVVAGNSSREWRIVYGGANIAAPKFTSSFRWSNGIRDAAGNLVPAGSTSTCSTNPW